MASYWVTGVWKDNNQAITTLYIHFVGPQGFHMGQKVSLAQAIQLCETGNTLTTLRWDYRTAKWQSGEVISVVVDGHKKYLRTRKDAEVIDNLDNMINMAAFV